MSNGEAVSKTECPACPNCGGSTTLRKSRKSGDAFFGCDRYPDCAGLVPCDEPADGDATTSEPFIHHPTPSGFLTPDNERNIMASIILGAMLGEHYCSSNSGRSDALVKDARWYTDRLLDELSEGFIETSDGLMRTERSSQP